MTNNKMLAWINCCIAAMFFFYEFMQMNFINAISPDLIQTFHINATQLGLLSSSYLIANIFFILPGGMILDRYSTRKIILSALLICIMGTILMSTSQSLTSAIVYRFFTGIGGAFCLISCLRLASRWFEAQDMAKITGVIIFIAMLGGLSSQVPVAYLSHFIPWRHILLLDAGFGLLIWLCIAFFVNDYPKDHQKAIKQQIQDVQSMGWKQCLKQALSKPCTWMAGSYTLLTNLPLSLFGITWGILYMQAAHQLSRLQAAEISSLLFVGTIFGSPFIGWLSDQIQHRRNLMIGGSSVSLLLVCIILYIPQLPISALAILFFVLGFTTSTQVLGYPVVNDTSPPEISATSMALAATIIMGGQAILQPVFGYLIDLQTHGHMGHLVTHDFSRAIFVFPSSFIIAIIIAFLLPESYKKNTHAKMKPSHA